jgi:hypothetical protein
MRGASGLHNPNHLAIVQALTLTSCELV